MNLSEAAIEEKHYVGSLELPIGTRRRLEALGMTPGTLIVVLSRKRNGSLIFKLRGTRFAIGQKIARGIELREETK